MCPVLCAQDEMLELSLETDIDTVGTLTLRVGSQLEFMHWMAALHSKWEAPEAAAPKQPRRSVLDIFR